MALAQRYNWARERFRRKPREPCVRGRPTAPGDRFRHPVYRLRRRGDRFRHRDRRTRRVSLYPRHLPRDVPAPAVDDASVCRLLGRRRVESPLPLPLGAGNERAVGRFRPAHPDRLRQRSRDGTRRSRTSRSSDRLDRGHATPVRGNSPRSRDDFDDDQRHGADPPGALSRSRRGTGRLLGASRRNGAERHPQGVCRARHLHLPARAVSPPGD